MNYHYSRPILALMLDFTYTFSNGHLDVFALNQIQSISFTIIFFTYEMVVYTVSIGAYPTFNVQQQRQKASIVIDSQQHPLPASDRRPYLSPSILPTTEVCLYSSAGRRLNAAVGALPRRTHALGIRAATSTDRKTFPCPREACRRLGLRRPSFGDLAMQLVMGKSALSSVYCT